MLITATGALLGLAFSIILILRKTHPVYALFAGAILGGLIGGAQFSETLKFMMEGAKGMIPAILRVLSAGILAGVLIESGAAAKIAETIIEKTGHSNAMISIILSTFVLTSVGLFVVVAVLIVAPIALITAQKAGISKMAVLLAMIGGSKAGNIISPNPNTIAAADAFKLDLSSVMAAGLIPAFFGLVVTIIISMMLKNTGDKVLNQEMDDVESEKPNFYAAIAGPLVAILLLLIRPLFGINIDPLIALPLGGIVGALAMKKIKNINTYASAGINRMSSVAILLIGAGLISGIISNSNVKDLIIQGLQSSGISSVLLAPLSGMFMSAATASTTAATAVASNVFGPTILSLGVGALPAAAMIHSGATVLDHMPHGNFFHVTAESVKMNIRQRLKLIPYETIIGLILATVSTVIYGFLI